MLNKLKKYYNYVERFAKSPNKMKIFTELNQEIKDKGVIEGVQSLLHMKSGKYVPEISYDFVKQQLAIAEQYDKSVEVTLPYFEKPKVSIIIPIYNQIEFTYSCIMSIFENNKGMSYEIIVADDNSPDDSSVLNSNFKNLRLFKNETNKGFLKNCNDVVKNARGEYLLFLNNDTQVLTDWLKELLFIFEQFPDAGAVGSKLIYPNGMLQEAGGIVWKDGSATNFGGRRNPDAPEYNYVKESDYISGASLMVKRSVWDEIGGFDERYAPAYNEDSDLCFAVRKAGYKVYYQPFSVVIHFEGMSHGRDVSKGVKKYQVVNREKFYEKWKQELSQKASKDQDFFHERDRSKGAKHVLIVDHNVPTVDKDAGSRTINNFVDSLISLGCKVKFLVPNMYPLASYNKLLQQKGVEVLHGDDFVHWRHEWERYMMQNMNHFSMILLSRSSICMPYVKFLRKNNYKGRIIYYGHDLGYLRLQEEAKLKNDASLIKEADNIKANEDFMYNQSDGALVISYEEQQYLEAYIKKPLYMVPPYYFDSLQVVPAFDERKGMLYVGGFHHPPNRDAMKWFLEEIYPSVSSIPMTIAGSEMPQFIYDFQQKYPLLTVKADVPVDELKQLYSQARIVVVPLTLGAGVKGKVVEAMAYGVPIVGTSKAFEGLSKDGFLYESIDDASVFAKEVEALYNDAARWQTLSLFGLQYIKTHFNQEKMKAVFKQLI